MVDSLRVVSVSIRGLLSICFDEMLRRFLRKAGTLGNYSFSLTIELASLGQNISRAVELSFFSLILPKEGFFRMCI